MRPGLTILVPTLSDGSRPYTGMVVDRFRETLERESITFDIELLYDYPSWGQAVIAGLEAGTREWVLAAGDDGYVVEDRWWDRARRLAFETGGLVGAALVRSDNGAAANVQSERALQLGGQSFPAAHLSFPLAHRSVWDRLQPLCPSHHYADCYMAERALRLGVSVYLCGGWTMIHYCDSPDQPGDVDVYESHKRRHLHAA